MAIDEADLILISEPKFSEVDGLVEEGKDFTFSIECEVKPALELSDYSRFTSRFPSRLLLRLKSTGIDNLGNAYHDYKNAPANTKVKADSVVELDIRPSTTTARHRRAVQRSSPCTNWARGLFPAAFDEELVGCKKGEEALRDRG